MKLVLNLPHSPGIADTFRVHCPETARFMDEEPCRQFFWSSLWPLSLATGPAKSDNPVRNSKSRCIQYDEQICRTNPQWISMSIKSSSVCRFGRQNHLNISTSNPAVAPIWAPLPTFPTSPPMAAPARAPFAVAQPCIVRQIREAMIRIIANLFWFMGLACVVSSVWKTFPSLVFWLAPTRPEVRE